MLFVMKQSATLLKVFSKLNASSVWLHEPNLKVWLMKAIQFVQADDILQADEIMILVLLFTQGNGIFQALNVWAKKWCKNTFN